MPERPEKKEADTMMTVAERLLQDPPIVREMREYIEKLKRQQEEDPEQAKRDAIAALIRTGVLDENGNPKEKIVSWE